MIFFVLVLFYVVLGRILYCQNLPISRKYILKQNDCSYIVNKHIVRGNEHKI